VDRDFVFFRGGGALPLAAVLIYAPGANSQKIPQIMQLACAMLKLCCRVSFGQSHDDDRQTNNYVRDSRSRVCSTCRRNIVQLVSHDRPTFLFRCHINEASLLRYEQKMNMYRAARRQRRRGCRGGDPPPNI